MQISKILLLADRDYRGSQEPYSERSLDRMHICNSKYLQLG